MANSQVDPSLYSRERALLDEALDGKPKEFREKVMRLVEMAGLTPNDPMFLLLISTGRLELMLEEAPASMERLFKNWTENIYRSFDLVESAIVEKQKLAISKAVSSLISDAEQKQAQRFLGSLVPAAALLLAAIGLGFAMGIAIPPYLQGGYVEEVKLTSHQAEALRWAESGEGKFARNLMKWNAGYLDNLECQKDVTKLKIVLKWGSRTSTSGFCAIWVRPPERRQFKD